MAKQTLFKFEVGLNYPLDKIKSSHRKSVIHAMFAIPLHLFLCLLFCNPSFLL